MRLYFKQRFFSWFDSYDIYAEDGAVAYTVEGKLAWGHCLHILDAAGRHIATVKERVLTFLPKFEMYVGDNYIGCIEKEFTFFKPRFTIDCRGWDVEGSFLEWDYTIRSGGRTSYILWVDLIGTWCFGVPLACISAFVWKLPVHWVYGLLSLEECVRLAISLGIFRSRRWMRRLEA